MAAGETWEVLRHGAAASFMLDDRGARMIDNPSNEIRSTIDIFVKDMGLVTAAARAKSYLIPLASAAEQLYLAGRRAGLGRADDSSVVQILRGTASAGPHESRVRRSPPPIAHDGTPPRGHVRPTNE